MSGAGTEEGLEAAHAGALACLPGMGPATLHRLLEEAPPTEMWSRVRSGAVVRPPAAAPSRRGAAPVSWADAATRMSPAALAAQWRSDGIGVTWAGDPAFPARLRQDPEPPGVLFWRGELDGLAGCCVAVIGTRRCSPEGRAVAYEMGRDLAASGVCVVSGLALGIDGAAHLGALDSGERQRTVGVAASGVDVPYPSRHRALWARVAGAGAVVSETPPGRAAQAWRFPARNRVIAGLSDLVVVVESHATGGSLITVDKAMERGIEVRAVPGPVHAASAAGSNQLLYDGPGPVRDATDVLDALGTLHDRPAERLRHRRAPRPEQLRLAAAQPPPLGRLHDAVLAAVGWRPTSLGRVVERSGEPVAVVAGVLEELLVAGRVSEEQGWWTRRHHSLCSADRR